MSSTPQTSSTVSATVSSSAVSTASSLAKTPESAVSHPTVSSTLSTTQQLPEDRLFKTWRSLVNWLLLAAQKAERTAAKPQEQTVKELDEYVVAFLRSRQDWSKTIGQLEAMLAGQAQERANLQHFASTLPQLKRKRAPLLDADNSIDAINNNDNNNTVMTEGSSSKKLQTDASTGSTRSLSMAPNTPPPQSMPP